LTVVGLSGLVLGLLEWPPLGLVHPLVVSSLVVGVVCMVILPVVERRVDSPMLPLALFHSRTFSLANLLTLLLYAALAVMMFLIPLNLIQVQGYSATAAGAALLPFPVIMFALSRWSGTLVAKIGSRIPLSVGPAVAAVGLFAFTRAGVGGSFWTTFLPGIVILGVGMAITVAPLTTTVMNAADQTHSGAASGVNNAVSRVGGLLAIAVFGVMLSRSFDTAMAAQLRSIPLSAEARAGVTRELPKMAGADLSKVSSLNNDDRARVHMAVNESFAGAFTLSMIVAAVLALLSAAVGFFIVSGRTAHDAAHAR
jgi:predicted MFS family arabinose efflux permease